MRFLLLLLVVAMTTGCTATTGRIAMVTTRSPDPRPSGPPRHARGRNCTPVLFFFPVGPMPNLGQAIDDAIGQGTVLTDVTVRYWVFYVPPLFGHGCYVVEGTAS